MESKNIETFDSFTPEFIDTCFEKEVDEFVQKIHSLIDLENQKFSQLLNYRGTTLEKKDLSRKMNIFDDQYAFSFQKMFSLINNDSLKDRWEKRVLQKVESFENASLLTKLEKKFCNVFEISDEYASVKCSLFKHRDQIMVVSFALTEPELVQQEFISSVKKELIPFIDDIHTLVRSVLFHSRHYVIRRKFKNSFTIPSWYLIHIFRQLTNECIDENENVSGVKWDDNLRKFVRIHPNKPFFLELDYLSFSDDAKIVFVIRPLETFEKKIVSILNQEPQKIDQTTL